MPNKSLFGTFYQPRPDSGSFFSLRDVLKRVSRAKTKLDNKVERLAKKDRKMQTELNTQERDLKELKKKFNKARRKTQSELDTQQQKLKNEKAKRKEARTTLRDLRKRVSKLESSVSPAPASPAPAKPAAAEEPKVMGKRSK